MEFFARSRSFSGVQAEYYNVDAWSANSLSDKSEIFNRFFLIRKRRSARLQAREKSVHKKSIYRDVALDIIL